MADAVTSGMQQRRWCALSTQTDIDFDSLHMEHYLNLQFARDAASGAISYFSLQSSSGTPLVTVRHCNPAVVEVPSPSPVVRHPPILCFARAYRDPFKSYAGDIALLSAYLGTPISKTDYPYQWIEEALESADAWSGLVSSAAVAMGLMPLRFATVDPFLPLGAMRLYVARNGSMQTLRFTVEVDDVHGTVELMSPITVKGNIWREPSHFDYTIRDTLLRPHLVIPARADQNGLGNQGTRTR